MRCWRTIRRRWALVGAGLLVPVLAIAQSSPDSLLEDIGAAVESTSYSGTMIRSVDGRIDTMRVLRTNRDGVVREKLVALDGEGREIIRNGNELICLLPGRQIKLIDTNASPTNTLVRLPTGSGELDRFYTLRDLGSTRIAGRAAQAFFVQPLDRFRYGHRIWIDAESKLPLRMQLVSRKGVVEEIRFTDIAIGIDIPDSEFVSDIDSSEFRIIRADQPQDGKVLTSTTGNAATGGTPSPSGRVAASWPSEPSPGFRLRSTQTQTVRINGQVAQRYVYSDGLASVSMFIAPQNADRTATTADGRGPDGTQLARSGAAHSYQMRIGDKTVTLVGEVPEETLRMLAERAEQELREPTVNGAEQE